jgi:hypothetical protein
MFAMNGMLDSIAEDRASGQGEALDVQAVLLGIPAPIDIPPFAWNRAVFPSFEV